MGQSPVVLVRCIRMGTEVAVTRSSKPADQIVDRTLWWQFPNELAQPPTHVVNGPPDRFALFDLDPVPEHTPIRQVRTDKFLEQVRCFLAGLNSRRTHP